MQLSGARSLDTPNIFFQATLSISLPPAYFCIFPPLLAEYSHSAFVAYLFAALALHPSDIA